MMLYYLIIDGLSLLANSYSVLIWFRCCVYVCVYICVYVYIVAAAAAAKSLQSRPTLFDPIDGSPPGSAIPGILQARTLEWVAISFSNAWKWKVKVKLLSCVRLFATPWTAAYQAPPSMGFSRQEYWSGVHVYITCGFRCYIWVCIYYRYWKRGEHFLYTTFFSFKFLLCFVKLDIVI